MGEIRPQTARMRRPSLLRKASKRNRRQMHLRQVEWEAPVERGCPCLQGAEPRDRGGLQVLQCLHVRDVARCHEQEGRDLHRGRIYGALGRKAASSGAFGRATASRGGHSQHSDFTGASLQDPRAGACRGRRSHGGARSLSLQGLLSIGSGSGCRMASCSHL